MGIERVLCAFPYQQTAAGSQRRQRNSLFWGQVAILGRVLSSVCMPISNMIEVGYNSFPRSQAEVWY